MNRVLQATYHDGSLVLDEKLDAALEGKKLKIVVIQDSAPAQLQDIEQSVSESRKQLFLKQIRHYSFKLPENYQFDREELYER